MPPPRKAGRAGDTIIRFLSRAPLAVLLVAFLALGLLYSWITPLFEAPDEVWHYAYVRWLAEGHGLPSMTDDASGANQEVAQPPLYYALATIYSVPFNDESLDDLIWHNPGFGYQAPGTVPDNKNMLVHTEVEGRWPWPEAVLAVRSARLASLFFGALTVIATWGLAYETFIDRRAALITAALVAFHPQFVFMSGVVNNDVSAAALATAVLWMVARILRRALSLRYVALTGALVGLAALAKTSALLVAPLAGAAILWAGWREERSWAEILKLLVLYTAIALAVGGWWYARNTLLYGDPLGLTSHVQTLWGRPEPISLLQLIPELPLLIRSFWGAYGWGHVWWPDVVYVLPTLIAFWFLGCTFWSLLRFAVCVLRSECRVSAERRREQGMLALALFWFGLILAALLRWMTLVEAPHGRLLFPAIGAWALLVGAGSGEIPDEAPLGEARRFVFRLFLLFLAALATLAPGARILATFAPPRLRSPEVVLPEVTPVELDYEERARLLGISVEPQRVNPGGSVEIRACWEALRPMSQDYTVFVQLLGPENIIVGERRTYPGLGRFPTSIWPVGQAFCDTYRLRVASWAEVPLLYRVEVGLFDHGSGDRLAAVNATGEPVDPPVVAGVSVVPASPIEASPAMDLDVRLGAAIRLHGFDRVPEVEAGETLTVTLYWEALQDVDEDLVAFVHLWQPGDEEPLAQHDAPPREGWFPTTAWREGDRVPDSHTLAIPATLAPGRYPLWAGLYRAEDVTRLPAFGPEGRLPYDLVPLGEIEVMTRQ